MHAAMWFMFMTALGGVTPHVPARPARAEVTVLTSQARHVRPETPGARYVLQLAAARSKIVRDLLDDLDKTDLVVFVAFVPKEGSDRSFGHMKFLHATSYARYVEITLYNDGVPPILNVPRLAHELWHARELAAAPEVNDESSFARLFQRIGYRCGLRSFETNAARGAEKTVRNELGVGSRP